MRRKFGQIICLCLLLMAGCTTDQRYAVATRLAVGADGQERSYPQPIAITVGEFLRQANVELGPLDEVTPPLFTQISDGMRITVTRVQETQECENQEMPFHENRIPNEGLEPRRGARRAGGTKRRRGNLLPRHHPRRQARRIACQSAHRHHRAAGRRDLCRSDRAA